MIEKVLKLYSNAPIQRHLLLKLLKDYKRPNDKISDMMKKGELIALKRGLYVPGDASDLPRPSVFNIANHIYGPSYISLASGLSYWGLIPEKVVEISSVTTKVSKSFQTPVGRFSYQYLPLPYYSFGIKQEQITENQTVLIASPEKAICDIIVLTSGIHLRSEKQTLTFLFDDMRMDEESVTNLNTSNIKIWLPHAPKKSSLEMLVKTLERL